MNFTELALPSALTTSLLKMEYKDATPVQEQCIPLALAGRDILASAQTGTGKTAAFAIPMIAKLMESPRGAALIMLPTRELAVQVVGVIKQMLGAANSIKTALLIGGESMHPQFKALQMRPRIIVGTPGRINDHLERGSLKLHDAGILVLDETDRMLDMGFGIQIDKILKFVPKIRQTMLFSATLPHNIMGMAAKYLTNPQRIEVGTNNKPIENVTQEIIHTTDLDKYNELLRQLNARSGTIIVFVKTKRGADRLMTKLNKDGHHADTIHGDLPQKKRDRVIKAFRDKVHRIMVATDVAARGLDIPHIEHVINYDLPMQPEDYIHRIGRTARNGETGSAIMLVTPDDRPKLNAINRLIDPNAKQERFERPAGAGKSPYNKSRGGSQRGGFGGGNGGKKPGGGGFKKREGGSFGGGERKTANEGGQFKPRGESKPRDGEFKPRESRDGEFKPRGDFKPRESRDGEFKPRGDFKPREGGNDGNKPFRGRKSDSARGGFGGSQRKEGGFAKKPGGGNRRFGGKPSGSRFGGDNKAA